MSTEKSLMDIVNDVSLVTKTSKAGNQYKVLHVVLTDGNKVYEVDNFVSTDQLYIIESLLERVSQ